VKASGSGARRYAWCRSQAVWLNMALVARLEDLEGAIAARQPGLIRYSATAIGEDCAVILALVARNEKPLPSRKMRASWALERIRGHELWPACWQLVRSFDADEPDAEIQAACQRLVAATRAIVGDVPDALTHDGYFPAIAMTRDWYKLLGALGEEGFFPEEWSRRASPSAPA
jgi:hypothetical protein